MSSTDDTGNRTIIIVSFVVESEIEFATVRELCNTMCQLR